MLSNSPSIWYCFPRAATFGIIIANLGAPGKHSTCNHITNHMKCRTRISHAITGNLFPQKVHFNDVTPATFLISFPRREPSPVHLPAIDMVKNGGQGIRAARLRAKKWSLSQFWSEEEQIGRKEDTDQGDGRRLRMIVEQGAEDRGNQSEHQSVGLNLDLRKIWKWREGAGGEDILFQSQLLGWANIFHSWRNSSYLQWLPHHLEALLFLLLLLLQVDCQVSRDQRKSVVHKLGRGRSKNINCEPTSTSTLTSTMTSTFWH